MSKFVTSIAVIIVLATTLLDYPYCTKAAANELAKIKGADMTLYNLYLDNKGKDKDLSVEYAIMFLDRLDTTSYNQTVAKIYEDVADYYETDKFAYSKAIQYRERSHEIYKRLDDKYNTAVSGYRLAELYLQKGYYHLTLKYASEALYFFEKNKYTSELIECYKLLGIVYEACGDYKQSEIYFAEYAKMARIANDSTKYLIGLNNTAALASTIGDTAKTIKLINECIMICKEIGDTARLCKLYLNASAAYIEADNPSKAEEYLKNSEPLLSNIELKGHYWLNRANLCIIKGDNSGTIANIEKSIFYYSQGEFDSILKSLYSSLKELYEKDNETIKAYKCLDTLYNMEKRSPEKKVWQQLFQVQNEIIQEKTLKERESHTLKQTITLTLSASLIIVAILIIVIIQRQRAYERRRMAAETKNTDTINEIKETQQFRTNRIIENVDSKLKQLATETGSVSLRNRILAISNELRESKDQESFKDIEQFIPEFNGEFYKRLKKDYPALTINESRICVFLNKNLSTKQISEITRQTPESINIARTRLRKKLGIDGQKISLHEFLSKYDQ